MACTHPGSGSMPPAVTRCPRKSNSTPARTRSISRWKVFPAFLMPKVIRVNSNRPNGVVIAVLGMSPGFMGIWWYPFFRSIFEKIVQPAALATKLSLIHI